MVCGKEASTGEIIAKSANQIVPPKFRGGTKMLYYIHQTPLSSWRVEGGSGDETTQFAVVYAYLSRSLRHKTPTVAACFSAIYLLATKH